MIRAAVLALLIVAPLRTDAACRQALALGLDVSGSVDEREYRLQLDGLATALTSPAVEAALLAPGAAAVRITVYEWSGPEDQTVILPWTEISDAAVLAQSAAQLRSHPRAPASLTTALGAAMMTGVMLLREASDCWTQTLDISGDGPANTGPRPRDLPASAIPAHVIVNGLVVGSGDQSGDDARMADIKELSSYYRTEVISGPGAFVETALGFEDYANAMERKLLRELMSMATSALP